MAGAADSDVNAIVKDNRALAATLFSERECGMGCLTKHNKPPHAKSLKVWLKHVRSDEHKQRVMNDEIDKFDWNRVFGVLLLALGDKAFHSSEYMRNFMALSNPTDAIVSHYTLLNAMNYCCGELDQSRIETNANDKDTVTRRTDAGSIHRGI